MHTSISFGCLEPNLRNILNHGNDNYISKKKLEELGQQARPKYLSADVGTPNNICKIILKVYMKIVAKTKGIDVKYARRIARKIVPT